MHSVWHPRPPTHETTARPKADRHRLEYVASMRPECVGTTVSPLPAAAAATAAVTAAASAAAAAALETEAVIVQ